MHSHNRDRIFCPRNVFLFALATSSWLWHIVVVAVGAGHMRPPGRLLSDAGRGIEPVVVGAQVDLSLVELLEQGLDQVLVPVPGNGGCRHQLQFGYSTPFRTPSHLFRTLYSLYG